MQFGSIPYNPAIYHHQPGATSSGGGGDPHLTTIFAIILVLLFVGVFVYGAIKERHR